MNPNAFLLLPISYIPSVDIYMHTRPTMIFFLKRVGQRSPLAHHTPEIKVTLEAYFIMLFRQKLQATILLFLIFVAFASYHKGTGSTAWLQWAAVIVMLTFGMVFDLGFTDNKGFIFDPDADNWRRKTEAGQY